MFTNNYYNYISLINPFTRSRGLLTVTKYDGSSVYLNMDSGGSASAMGLSIANTVQLLTSNNPGQNICIGVGSGNTAESPNDYTLENVITSGLSMTTGYSQTYSDGVLTSSFLATLSNKSSSDITIKEIGIYTKMDTSNTPTGSTTVYSILIFRKVLNEPITIQAGASKTITLSFSHEV